MVVRQIDLICAPQLKSAERLTATQKATRCTFSLVSSITQRDAICGVACCQAGRCDVTGLEVAVGRSAAYAARTARSRLTRSCLTWCAHYAA